MNSDINHNKQHGYGDVLTLPHRHIPWRASCSTAASPATTLVPAQ